MEPTETLKLNQQVFVLGKDDKIFSIPIKKIVTIEDEDGIITKYFLPDDMADERSIEEIYLNESDIKASIKLKLKKEYDKQLDMVDKTEIKTYGK